MIVQESVLVPEVTGLMPDKILGEPITNLGAIESAISDTVNNSTIINNTFTAENSNNLLTNTQQTTTQTDPNVTDIRTDPLTGTSRDRAIVADINLLPETARSTASFVDSIATSGVNKKYDWNTVRGIADDIGIKHFRGLTKNENGLGTGVDRLVGNNYTYTVSVGNHTTVLDPSPQAVSQLLADIKNKHQGYRSRITALEGPNEYDYVDPNLDPNWEKNLTAFVKELYGQMRADPWFDGIPYVGPSFYRDYNMENLADLSQYMDAGNLHLYTNPPVDAARFNAKYSGYLSGNLPLYATEIGNNTKTATEELEQGRLYPRMYLNNFNRGVIRSHSHVLIDGDSNSTKSQKRYGIVRSDFTYKPAATTLKNTIDLLRDDSNSNNLTDFRFLDFSVDTTATDIEQTLLYHSSKDKYYLALWRGIPNDTANAANSIPVTIGFENKLASVVAYKPNEGNSGAIVPINKRRVNVDINDEVTFLEITLRDTANIAPVAPTKLTTVDKGPTGVQLNWQDNSTNEEGFGIERNDGFFGWRLVGTVDADVTSFVDRIQPNKNYRYRVRAVNSKGHSDYTNIISLTTPEAKIITDPLANFDRVDTKSSQLRIETPATPSLRYDGDANFVSFSTSTPQYVTYSQENLKDFTVVTYTNSSSLSSEANFYSSQDGINWQPIEINFDRVPTTKGRRTDVIFSTPKDILPDFTQYLRIEFIGISDFEKRLGRVTLIAS